MPDKVNLAELPKNSQLSISDIFQIIKDKKGYDSIQVQIVDKDYVKDFKLNNKIIGPNDILTIDLNKSDSKLFYIDGYDYSPDSVFTYYGTRIGGTYIPASEDDLIDVNTPIFEYISKSQMSCDEINSEMKNLQTKIQPLQTQLQTLQTKIQPLQNKLQNMQCKSGGKRKSRRQRLRRSKKTRRQKK